MTGEYVFPVNKYTGVIIKGSIYLRWHRDKKHKFFYKHRFFIIQPQCCLIFSLIELKMLLRCYLVHTSIIILKKNLYLVYFCPYVSLGLFVSYLYGLFFIFSLIFIFINYMTSLKQTQLVFAHFLEHLLIFLTITWMKKASNIQKVQGQSQGVA